MYNNNNNNNNYYYYYYYMSHIAAAALLTVHMVRLEHRNSHFAALIMMIKRFTLQALLFKLGKVVN